MKKLILLLLFTLVLVGCEKSDLEATVNSLGDTPTEILQSVAEGYGTDREYSVWVYDHEIRFDQGDDSFTVDLTDELFYMSVAPYINDTHT